MSVMGVYGSAEKVLSVHSPAKIPAAPLQAVAWDRAVRAVRPPQQAGAAEPKKRVAKFAALSAKAKAKAKTRGKLR